MARDTDTRTVTLVDIPLVRRLTDRATVLDSETEFTRDVNGANGSLLPSILLPQRGLYTLVCRSDKQHVIGQFRIRSDQPNAHILYIAPHLEADDDDTVWLHILDAMVQEAGRHNAHSLVAEVREDSSLFETMRVAGFSVYARQQIWQRMPDVKRSELEQVELFEETDADEWSIQSLITQTVPALTQQIIAPPSDMDGWVYRTDGRIDAYVAVSEGKHGIYIIPYFHPDMMQQAASVLESVVMQMHRAGKVPVYVCVRRYQEWVGNALQDLQFEPGPRQAVMVKHIAAGVRHPVFRQPAAQGVPATGSLKPPTKVQPCKNNEGLGVL